MDRKDFIKLGILSGVSAALFGYFSPKGAADESSFLIISGDPAGDRKKILSLTGSSKRTVINVQPVRSSAQDLTIIKDNKIINPVTDRHIDKRISDFANELRGRKQPGNTLISVAFPHEDESSVTFEVSNNVAEKIQLFRNYESIVIPGIMGNTEFSLIDGKLSVVKASCRHNICKRMDGITKGRIICVPNKVIASINSSRNSAVDAVTG
jgi:hypothetical protein